MNETDEYDRIFSALKHPVRRQILFVLEEKGEISFTQLQKEVDIQDTGLLSYHLKELSQLVKQNERGRYDLSETGHASLALFRRVEKEKQMSTKAAQKYVEELTGKIVYLFIVLGITTVAPLSIDILMSVQMTFGTLFFGQIVLLLVLSTLGIILGLILFVFYDRHYFTRNLRINAIHTTVFAAATSFLSAFTGYTSFSFYLTTAAIGSSGSSLIDPSVFVLRAILVTAAAPGLAYIVSRIKRRNK